MKILAIFDFDGTITDRDTLLEFTKFSRGRLRFYCGFLLLSPLLVLYKIKLIPNWKAKEWYLWYFFGGKANSELIAKGIEFCREVVPGLVRKKAMERILEYQLQDDVQLVLATASVDIWVDPWARDHSFQLISTRLESVDGRVTGKIMGKNCFGKAKLDAVRSHHDFSTFDQVHFYGDSPGDKVFEGVVSHFYYREFE